MTYSINTSVTCTTCTPCKARTEGPPRRQLRTRAAWSNSPGKPGCALREGYTVDEIRPAVEAMEEQRAKA